MSTAVSFEEVNHAALTFLQWPAKPATPAEVAYEVGLSVSDWKNLPLLVKPSTDGPAPPGSAQQEDAIYAEFDRSSLAVLSKDQVANYSRNLHAFANSLTLIDVRSIAPRKYLLQTAEERTSSLARRLENSAFSRDPRELTAPIGVPTGFATYALAKDAQGNLFHIGASLRGGAIQCQNFVVFFAAKPDRDGMRRPLFDAR